MQNRGPIAGVVSIRRAWKRRVQRLQLPLLRSLADLREFPSEELGRVGPQIADPCDMAASNEQCIWMAAGVIAYRLCDRGFDCEHCPLDKALQGRSHSPDLGSPFIDGMTSSIEFPADRRYSRGHFWIGEALGKIRLGLDAFGAHLVGSVNAVRGAREKKEIAAGEGLVELDLGLGNLTLRSPVGGLFQGINPCLRDQPDLLLRDCYRKGWLTELAGGSSADGSGARLLDHREIKRCAHHDLKRFRRRIAHYLLADELSVGPTLADGGVLLNDLRAVLGFPRFLELVDELLG